MNVKHEQFIGIYENAFSKEYCDSMIDYFEKMNAAGFTANRQKHDQIAKTFKDDLAVFPTFENLIGLENSGNLLHAFHETLWGNCYPAYIDQFWSLKDVGSHGSHSAKIQKTEPGQGYHVWHCEASAKSNSHRILAWTLYLNDVEEGGETEFIYQHMRIKPKQGTFVLWPAAFTHTHRGNPPISNTKYIVTGWIEY
jgi:hypothetical protein